MKPLLTCCVLTISLLSFFMWNLKCMCVCWYWKCLSLSLPHANVWFSFSAWEERRRYNDTVTPVLHLQPYHSLCCFSADALHALAPINNSLAMYTFFLIWYDGKEYCMVVVPFKLCGNVVIVLWSFCGMHHRNRDICDLLVFVRDIHAPAPSCFAWYVVTPY